MAIPVGGRRASPRGNHWRPWAATAATEMRRFGQDQNCSACRRAAMRCDGAGAPNDMTRSAGILLFRRTPHLQIFLVHPGGPYWSRKDLGAWSIPKGEVGEGEDVLSAARREFTEETSFSLDGVFLPLDPIKQAGGKVVYAWAVEGDCDASTIRSETFMVEWPPNSGRQQEFPEVDRAAWFNLAEARRHILPSQCGLLEQLASIAGAPRSPG